MSIDSAIDQAFAPVSNLLSAIIFFSVPVFGHEIKLILVYLVLISLFLTLYLGFINFRYFRHSIDLLKGKYPENGARGQINNYQTLSTSLASTVGLGNIAGVAVAVSVGGPGAVFWMIFMGFFGMCTKFAEATLGIKYRHIDTSEDGDEVNGGPMHYIRAAFSKLKMGGVGRGLAVFYAVCFILASFGAGNMFQANQSFQQFVIITGGEDGFLADKGWLFGIVLAVLVGAVILGGLKSIAAASSKIVPLMALLYLGGGMIVLIFHIQEIPQAIATICKEALYPQAGLGALIGALLMGIQRATFSNEAGIGSAAVIHSAAKTDRPAAQGFVAMLGPFIDTVVICAMTGLVIVITGAYSGAGGMEGVALTSRAFGSVMPWFPILLAFIVFLFAYSTLIGWSYYGMVCSEYLFGNKKSVVWTYKIIFLLCTVIGSAATLTNVIGFTDAAVFAMAIPNVLALYILAPEVKAELRKYLQQIDIK